MRASTGVASPHGAVVALHGGQLEAEARPTTTMADAMRAHAFTPLGGPPPTDPHGATAPAWTPPPPSSSTVGLGQPTGPTVVQSVGPSVPAESRAEKSTPVVGAPTGSAPAGGLIAPSPPPPPMIYEAEAAAAMATLAGAWEGH